MGSFRSALHGEMTAPNTKEPIQSVQVFGRKKTATAVAYCKRGHGLIKVNGRPLSIIEPRLLQYKLYEPILLLGKDRFAGVDIRIKVKGGGHVAQVYAIRQAIAKSLVAYYQKYVDEASKQEIKDILINFDRSLLVADPPRCEAKKFGGPGARQIPEILPINSFRVLWIHVLNIQRKKKKKKKKKKKVLCVDTC